MMTQANLFVENKIRAGLRVTRLFMEYAPFNLARRLQKLALYRFKLAGDILTSLTDKPAEKFA